MSLRAPLRRIHLSRAIPRRQIPAIRSLTTASPRLVLPRPRPIVPGHPGYTTPTPTTSTPRITTPTHRTYSTSNSTGKPTADLIVDELQELYEVAKDEFEIATESTDSATIYAASDRESARDALDELVAVYTVYTRDGSFVSQQGMGIGQGQGLVNVDTGLNPEEVEEGVRSEVKRRVGTRVRELVGAVEALEERANAHD
ncbi:hypothetical protein BO94DRAFT_625565 [Aspergillus sclerotioniger CBS 115572]|uniref:Uncharacterized protein n=1 Tax=Aspergillus sclerotioniger CBS 115572 TaxID=1450535 RepID=A0A317W996_9EURO|nr:hypothetical protein BO94DRAFT_625565 [Aspergillus sclerotioniger CBS 115572]PWY83194.1 hypothetical protein BO94DRAFT_625565 [Aspergillus sclerotioniger CBS 115572]